MGWGGVGWKWGWGGLRQLPSGSSSRGGMPAPVLPQRLAHSSTSSSTSSSTRRTHPSTRPSTSTSRGRTRHEASRKALAGRQLALLVAQQALVDAVGAHAQRVLERQVHGERREPLPQRAGPLLGDHRLAAVHDACARAGGQGGQGGGEGRRAARARWAAALLRLLVSRVPLRKGCSPLYLPTLSSCSRVLMTSIGCRHAASTTPPRDPAAGGRSVSCSAM